ncbi:AMP-binding protein [Pseudonocardia acaciae]|uniref:AMP-binding protein n=1 Tax=Pseudonocardia acaciae TaxID=551276 RepID=UPI00048FADD1|nr:AMP-binding protein [Pseudonocardia acaciae]
MRTFAELLLARAGDDHIGLRAEGLAWTWGEVVERSARRAALLRELATPGRPPHVGVLLENVPDYVFWIGAAALAGAAVVGINPTRRGAELAHDIRHTDCDLIVTEGRLVGLLDGLEHGVPPDRVLDIDDPGYQDLLRRHRGAEVPERPPSGEATLLLLFSSGSTGAPKAVVCSQRRLGMLAQALSVRTELARESVTYLCMPLFHGNSVMMNLAPSVYVGATVCLARRFSASGFARDVHRHRVTFVNYVGRALAYVLDRPESPEDRASSLRLAVGTEASVADAARFGARFGCRVSEGYGLSEGVLRINRTAGTPEGALGLPVGGADVRVLDEVTGEECPPAVRDERGRLLNADAAIGQIVGVGLADRFEGYYKNPGAHAERVRGDDFWTGDLGYRDADGYFYFAGRSSDRLRVDGENFAAGPVERILERWADVSVALVYPVPDPRTGDQVMCALHLVPGGDFAPAAFARFLDGQPDLGTKWRPRFVRLVDRVPTTGSNKVAKAGLRRAGWRTEDPVFWLPRGDDDYVLFDDTARERLEREFAEHGRAALLPGQSGR